MPGPNKIRELSEAEAADAELRASMDLALEEARVKASRDKYERESRHLTVLRRGKLPAPQPLLQL